MLPFFESDEANEYPDIPETDFENLVPPDEEFPDHGLDDLPYISDAPLMDDDPGLVAEPVFSPSESMPMLPGLDTAEGEESDSGWAVIEAARFFGQEVVTDDGQTTYAVNALVIAATDSGPDAGILRVAEFENLAHAQALYVELQSEVGRSLTHNEIGSFAEFIAPPGTQWQPVAIDEAQQIVEVMDAFDRESLVLDTPQVYSDLEIEADYPDVSPSNLEIDLN